MSHVTYTPGRSTSLAVTDVSGRVALAGSGTVVRVLNAGASVAYVAIGDATVVAAVPGVTAALGAASVLAGEVAYFSVPFTAGYVAAICASGQTTTVLATRGEGRGTEGVLGSVAAYAAEAWMASQGWAGASLAADFVTQRYAIRAPNTGVAQYVPLSAFTFSRASTATYVDSAGVYRTANNNVLRFTYDPATLVAQGALLEGARTNLLTNTVFANSGGAAPTGYAAVIGTGTSAPATSTVNPAVSAYAQTATAERPVFAQAGFTFAASTTYSVSIVVEAVTGTVTAADLLRFSAVPAGTTISWPVCPANPAGTSGGAVGVGLLVMTVAVAGTAGAGSVYMGLGCNGNVTGTLRFSMPQYEVGPFASSWIPTTGATATRAADSLSISAVGLLSASAGTMYASGRTLTGGLEGVNGLLQVDDATNQNRVSLYQVSTASRRMALYIASGGVASADAAFGTAVSAGALARTAVAWGGSSASASVNGGAATTYGSVTSPSVSRLLVGGGGVGGNAWNNTVQSAVLFPTKLSDAQVQGLTQ